MADQDPKKTTPEASEEPGEPPREVLAELTKLPGVGMETARQMWSKGIHSASDLQGRTAAELGKLKGFTEEQAHTLLEKAGLVERVDSATTQLKDAGAKTLDTAKGVAAGATSFASKALGSVVARTGFASSDGEGHASLIEDLFHQLNHIPGLTRELAGALYKAGFSSVKKLKAASEEQLTRVEGMTKELAGKILTFARSLSQAEGESEADK